MDIEVGNRNPGDLGFVTVAGEPVENFTIRRRFAIKQRPWHFLPDGAEPVGAMAAATYVCGRWIGNAEAVEYAARWFGPATKTVYADGHYPVITLTNGHSITAAAQWFGPDAGPTECGAAWRYLQGIGRQFGGAMLLTPATTGRDWWARSIASEARLPVMSRDAQRWVRAISGQGRIEMFTEPGAPPAGGIFGYDMKLAYAACTRSMPMGNPRAIASRDPHRIADERRHGKYLCTWTVPDDWTGAGILPERVAGVNRWPALPGHGGRGWVDGVELWQAIRHGWRVEVETGAEWAESGDPFRLWQGRLLTAIDKAPDEIRPIVRYACRAMLLQTIGAMAGGTHRVTRRDKACDVPVNAEITGVLPDGTVQWVEHAAAKWADLLHPEWSSHVWARVRSRVFDHAGVGLAHVPAGKLIAVRTDGIYTSAEMPGWVTSSNAPGSWALKQHRAGPVSVPLTQAQLLRSMGGE